MSICHIGSQNDKIIASDTQNTLHISQVVSTKPNKKLFLMILTQGRNAESFLKLQCQFVFVFKTKVAGLKTLFKICHFLFSRFFVIKINQVFLKNKKINEILTLIEKKIKNLSCRSAYRNSFVQAYSHRQLTVGCSRIIRLSYLV